MGGGASVPERGSVASFLFCLFVQIEGGGVVY